MAPHVGYLTTAMPDFAPHLLPPLLLPPPRARSPIPSWLVLREPTDRLYHQYYAYDSQEAFQQNISRRRIPRPWGRGQGRPRAAPALPEQDDTNPRERQTKQNMRRKRRCKQSRKGAGAEQADRTPTPPFTRYRITIDDTLEQPFYYTDPEPNMRSEAELPDRMRYTAEHGSVEDVAAILEEAAVLGSNVPSGLRNHGPRHGVVVPVTMLGVAAHRNYTPLIAELLGQGAAVDGVPVGGDYEERARTPLLRAAFGGRLEAMRACLDAGADIDWRNAGTGNTLLMAVCEDWLSIGAVSLLLDEGCDVRATNAEGRCALMALVCGSRYSDQRRAVAELLVRWGADVNRRDKKGFTPLLLLANLPYHHSYSADAARILIDLGADVTARMPADYAPCPRGTAEDLVLLGEAAADPEDQFEQVARGAFREALCHRRCATRRGHGSSSGRRARRGAGV